MRAHLQKPVAGSPTPTCPAILSYAVCMLREAQAAIAACMEDGPKDLRDPARRHFLLDAHRRVAFAVSMIENLGW